MKCQHRGWALGPCRQCNVEAREAAQAREEQLKEAILGLDALLDKLGHTLSKKHEPKKRHLRLIQGGKP